MRALKRGKIIVQIYMLKLQCEAETRSEGEGSTWYSRGYPGRSLYAEKPTLHLGRILYCKT